MRRLGLHLFVPALLAAACSAPRDRAECSASAPCGAGEYCAHTQDGSVCWPDAVAPVIQSVTVTCGTPCLRDGTLQVSATVTDDQELASVEASIPTLSGTRTVPMTESSGKWVAAVPLVEWPFPAFEAPVAVRVTAKDAAQNPAQLDAAGGNVPVVTRLKGTPYDAGAPITSPAVLADGTAVFGRTATSKQLVAVKDGVKVWDADVGTSSITAAPSVGESIWVGSQDGKLYPVAANGTAAGPACTTPGPIHDVVAVAGARAITASSGSRVAVADGTGFCNQSTVTGAPAFGPVIGTSGQVFVASNTTLYSFTMAPDGVLTEDWGTSPARPTLGGSIGAPLSVDATGCTLSLAINGKLDRTTAAAVTANVTSMSAGSTGPVVLSDGSIVLGDQSGVLRRIADAAAWSASDALTGVPAIPLSLEGDEPALLVPTSQGWLYAVKTSDGTIAWSVKLSSTGQPLQPANIFTVPGATTSTAYIGGADGRLYAVIVDGHLDTAAPWPKAFHDPRNTSNAGVAP